MSVRFGVRSNARPHLPTYPRNTGQVMWAWSSIAMRRRLSPNIVTSGSIDNRCDNLARQQVAVSHCAILACRPTLTSWTPNAALKGQRT